MSLERNPGEFFFLGIGPKFGPTDMYSKCLHLDMKPTYVDIYWIRWQKIMGLQMGKNTCRYQRKEKLPNIGVFLEFAPEMPKNAQFLWFPAVENM